MPILIISYKQAMLCIHKINISNNKINHYNNNNNKFNFD